jgi:SH3-like domain-containing protein
MKWTRNILFIILFMGVFSNYVHALCIKVTRANVRSGPSTQYDIAWEIYKYMPFEKVGVSLSGRWYAVKDVDGDVNWIYKKLLTDKYRCVVVKKEQVNIRKGPGTNYSQTPSSPVQQYYTGKVLKRKGAWVKIKDEWGDIGWIHTNLLWIK